MSLGPFLRHHIYLIGDVDVQICGNKLPSKMQVLKVLFHNLRVVPLTLRESAKLVLREVKIFWDKARLPTQKDSRCIEKIERLHGEWSNLQKHRDREGNQEKEQNFLSEMKNLLDIAHGDILDKIDHEQTEFLENQRKDGRVGYINNIESIYDRMKQEELRRNQMMAERLEKSEKDKARLTESVELASSNGSPPQECSLFSLGSFSGVSFELSQDDDATPPPPKKSRGQINIFTTKVVAALDVCRVTDRRAVHLIAAIADALDISLETLILNKTSIHNYREQVREAKAANIKQVFQKIDLEALILHWDGKLLTDLLQRKVVDRLPVVVTNGDVEKVLGVPKLEDSKGVTQANAVYDVLEDWALLQKVKALCCDTTASNLGHKNGAAVLLERLLGTLLLFLPCRHHILELILRCVFECKLPLTVGPNVPLFEKFRKGWNEFDPLMYRSGIEDERVKSIITSEHIERITCFVEGTLKTTQPRDDYKEFLNLTLLFLGRRLSQQVKFYYPGAFHHARWMSKAIYCLKIFLFRDQFSMSLEELLAIRETCIFTVMLYVEAWFTAPLAVAAPNHDLQFMKKLHRYKTINEKISEVTVKKFSKHLWYLSAETVALSFFDDEIPLDVKRNMVDELHPYDEVDDIYPKRFELNLKYIDEFCNAEIDHFVTPQTRYFFSRFEIDEAFLKLDPSLWPNDKGFQKGLNIVRKIKIVNDVAERAVHLFSEYNRHLTLDEDQKQYIVQLVSDYHKLFPNANKETVMQSFE